MSSKKHLIKFLIVTLIVLYIASCTSKKGLVYKANRIPSNAKIAVIIDYPNTLKNVVLVSFLNKGFRVKAFNASDLYTMKDVYDISDLKKLSYNLDEQNVSTVEKTYDNIYKLHIYNFELNKAEFLKQIRNEWDVDYMLIIELNEWEKVSWARVVNLRTFEIDFVENYPTGYNDNIETIISHFANNITGK
ncbi:MAG TPA: hypothetical protein PK358_02190 [Spirochaetota bacterium]|nr:hypothetical protein [Spirochaetota bacterium]HPJ33615.1 hypothetical protein [Spirochaetota bacterium]